MSLKNWKTKFKKWLGMGVASAVLVSGLSAVAPTAAVASETTPTVPIPTKVTLTVDSTTSTQTTLKAVTDKPLQDSNSTLSLFKTGNTTQVSSSTTGTTHTFTVPRPTTTAYDQYYVTVAGLTSNTVTTHSNTTGTWQLNITPNKTSFKTQDAGAKITWTTNQAVNTTSPQLGVFIAEKATGKVVYKAYNSATTAVTGEIPKFYLEDYKEYIGYVANWTNTANSSLTVSMLTNVKTISNSVIIYRTPWSVTLNADHQVFSTDQTTTLDLKLNQEITSSTPFRAYIVNDNTGKIEDWLHVGDVYDYEIPKFLTGGPVTYKVVVAKNNRTVGNNASLLENIQATSNLLPISRAPWTLSLASNTNQYAEGEDRPELTWETNQPVDNAEDHYKVYIADKNTGEIFYTSYDKYWTSSITEVTEVPSFDVEDQSKQYVAYVAKHEDPTPSNVSDLEDIQATSNIITISRYAWELQISADKPVYSTEDENPIVSWTSNQTVDSPYKVFIADEAGDIVARQSFADGSTQGTLSPYPRAVSGDAKTYTAYIAEELPETPANKGKLSQLTNIQATSNPVQVQRLPWVVNLTADKYSFKTDEERPELTWQTNQTIATPNSGYYYYLADVTTGEIVSYSSGFEVTSNGTQGTHNVPKFLTGGEHEYKGYIAKRETTEGIPQTISELEDIQAISNSIFVYRYPWEISLGITNTIFSTDDETPRTTWSTNQSITDADDAYHVYVIQTETGKIISTSYGEFHHRNGNPEVERFYTGGPRTYKAIVAAWDPAATHVDNLTDVQAVSNTVTAQRAQWGVALEYEITGVDPTINQKRIEFSWYTNQSIDNTNNQYRLYIFNNTSGALLYTSDYSYHDKHAISVAVNSKETFIAYVAKRSTTITSASQLQDIQATSTAVFPEETSVTVKELEFTGGGNPSAADCNQQCYGDPVNSYNGEFFENYTDLSINALVPFDFTRSYSTWKRTENRGLGNGWRHNYDMSIQGDGTTLAASNYITVNQENGSAITFAKVTSQGTTYYIGSNNIQAKLTRNASTGKFTFERNNGYGFVFGTNGKLEQIKDRNSNALNFTYTSGKLTKITATSGQSLTITWGTANITSVTDGTRTVIYTYSTTNANHLAIVDLPEKTGHKQYTYDTSNRVKRVIQTNGGYYENFYDASNRVIKQVNPLGGETTFTYQTPSTGNVTVTTLPDGLKTREKYNNLGQLVEQKLGYTSSQEKTFTYEYDFSGQKSRETGPSGLLAVYSHDNNGNITSVKDALNRVSYFTYNQYSQILTSTDALGNITTNTYDSKGNLLTVTSPEGKITKFESNADGTTKSIQSPNDVTQQNSKKTLFGYDANKNLSSVTQPEGSTTTITNNSLGNPLSVKSALNNVTQYTYNGNFQVYETIAPNLQKTKTEYTHSNELKKSTNSLNQSTSYVYDLMGNLKTVTDVYGTTTYSYDNMQRLIKVVSPDGAETEYQYNIFGQPTKIIDALDNEETITYYNHGLVETNTDARGKTTRYHYDALGNTIKITDANGKDSSATYDALNRLKTSTSSNGYVESYSYDKDGNLTSSTKAGIETISHEYDANGNLTKTVYPDLSSEINTYDSDDQLLSTKNRDGKTTSYQYDNEGKVVKTVRADQTEIQYSYTNLGQLDQTTYDNWVTVDTDYDYDVHGRITQETKAGKISTYTYDAIGNMTRRGPPTGTGVTYSYDQFGATTGINYPSGIALQYEYDLNGNLKTVKKSGQTVAQYTYDANGNNTQTNYGNGTYETREFDSLSRLTSISLNNSSGRFYKKNLTLDNSGLIIGSNSKVNSTTTENKEYSYTSIQRLQKVTDSLNTTVKNYDFDSSSNLISSPWGTNTVTANGQLSSSSLGNKTVAYTHDNRGNRTQKNVSDASAPNKERVTDYQWSNDDKLAQVKDTSTTTNGSTTIKDSLTVDYQYDANGLLSTRESSSSSTTYINGAPSLGSTSVNPIENFTWDMLSAIPVLLEDNSDSFLYGVDSAPFAQVDKNTGTIEYLHGDERGSIVAASTATGAYSWHQKYDEYGTETQKFPQSGVQQISTRFAYAGEYQDPTTGLYNLRARWYEPETASFLNIDPAASITGEPYSYASANPLSYTDPLGLWSWSDTGNLTAGTLDGIIGFPAVSSFMNWASPGTVNLCSSIYTGSNVVGTIASFAIPGNGLIKSFGFAASFATKVNSFATKSYALTARLTQTVNKFASKASAGLKSQLASAKKLIKDDRGSVPIGGLLPSKGTKLPEMVYDRNKTPNIVDNIEKAWAQGHPKVLTYNGPNHPDTKANRKIATKGFNRKLYGSPDEYPFASTMEGGFGARVQGVPILEQNSQGGTMSVFYKNNNIKRGDQFIVTIIN